MGFSIRVDGKAVRLGGHLPLIPLRDVVVFPGMTLPLFVGRPASVASIERALEGKKILFATAQRRPEVSRPEAEDLHEVGTLIRVLQVFRLPDGTMRILVEGLERARLDKLRDEGDLLTVEATPLYDEDSPRRSLQGTIKRVQNSFDEFAKLSQRVPDEVRERVIAEKDSRTLSYLVAAHVLLKVTARQEVLEAVTAAGRLNLLDRHLSAELEILRLERKIESSTERSGRRRRSERGFAADLGDADNGAAEIEELQQAVAKARMPEEVETKAQRELERLARMPVFSPEATVTRTYISWLTSVPWKRKSRDRRDLAAAQRILDEDHFGLTKVKERILEHLAVVQLSRATRGPVLCLVGPPGVGKTSLARSVARALGRKFVRMSLGGVRDEAEIRGHRRTYIGSMPGRIVQAMRRAGTVNPVILLDEIDKLGADYRGDPASALLEVLDPEQNASFNDHYLEVDYDLSKTLFLTTANDISTIPHPLLDRMEIIRLSGYLETEKRVIANRFLLPRQLQSCGLKAGDLQIEPDALSVIIREYTREAGVRSLEREIGALCRKAARSKASRSWEGPWTVESDRARELLGVPRHLDQSLERAGRVGVANGLAWTESGGEVLLIEVKTLPGTGALVLTGRLGETMQESARAALSYVRSQSEALGLDPLFHKELDIHVHVPEGGVPKDGPSAGVAIALALISGLTGRATDSKVALSGEITLRGKVLPVGGLTEKAVAAHRLGVRTLIVPEGNRRHLSEIPEEIRDELTIVRVTSMDEVLRYGLDGSTDVSGETGQGTSEELYVA